MNIELNAQNCTFQVNTICEVLIRAITSAPLPHPPSKLVRTSFSPLFSAPASPLPVHASASLPISPFSTSASASSLLPIPAPAPVPSFPTSAPPFIPSIFFPLLFFSVRLSFLFSSLPFNDLFQVLPFPFSLHRLGSLLEALLLPGDILQPSFPLPTEPGHALAEVDVDPPIVNQHVVHLEVSLLTGLPVLKLDKSILEAFTTHSIPDHLALDHLPKSAKDNLKIVIAGDRIQFADKEYVLRWGHVLVGKVADNREDCSTSFCLLLGYDLVHFCLGHSLVVVDVLVRSNPRLCQ